MKASEDRIKKFNEIVLRHHKSDLQIESIDSKGVITMFPKHAKGKPRPLKELSSGEQFLVTIIANCIRQMDADGQVHTLLLFDEPGESFLQHLFEFERWLYCR